MKLRSIIHFAKLALTRLLMNLMPSTSYLAFIGQDSSAQLCGHVSRSGASRVLVVTDQILVELGVVSQALASINTEQIDVVIFDKVTPDPSFEVVAEGAAMGREHRSDAILAIGGGSSLDAGKMIAASIVSHADPRGWVGFNKLDVTPLPIFTIPTTSGTGSEATLGSVISDLATHQKVVIGDVRMQPSAVAIDSTLLQGMPPAITAATGMDALTHAIEAYVSRWDRGDSRDVAAIAVVLVFENLKRAYSHGGDLDAREGMALAAYYAGMAINQVNVGNVHAIAHQLGAQYGIPHGVANAMVLAPVLRLSSPQADQRLAELARRIGLGAKGEADSELAARFICEVDSLRDAVSLPKQAEALLEADFELIIERAVTEGDAYPAPVFFTEQEVRSILQELLMENRS